MKKRILSIFLAAIMIVSLLPVTALAVDTHTHEGWTPWGDNAGETGKLPTSPGNYYLTQNVTLTTDREISSGTYDICLNGHVINLNGNYIKVSNTSTTLNLHDCQTSVLHNGYLNSDGLWIWDENSEHPVDTGAGEKAYSIYGGIITGGKNTSSGGAIWLVESKMNMYGGTICGNKMTNSSNEGGAVHLQSGAKFTMTNSRIFGNYSAGSGGGVSAYSNTNGSFTMTDSIIDGNKAEKSGGGVYLYSNSCPFEMTGGSIKNNSAVTSGGGVYLNNVKFEMTDGQITGNVSTGNYGGGGVYTAGTAEFKMNSGAISGNKTPKSGGGVSTNDSSDFIMLGGTISDNEALNGAGVDNSANFYMNGGSITGNKAKAVSGGGGLGGGVCIGSSANAYFGGTSVIKGNLRIAFDGSSEASDVYSSSTNTRASCGNTSKGISDPAAGMCIGLYNAKVGSGKESYLEYFFADKPTQYVYLSGTTIMLGDIPSGSNKITVNSAHGTVSAPQYAASGAAVNLTVKPDRGYVLQSLKYSGGEIENNDITEAKSFTMPGGAVTVTAVFKEIEKTETAYWGVSNGKLYLSAAATVNAPTDFSTTESLEASAVPWAAQKDTITEVVIQESLIPLNTANWFSGCSNLVSVPAENISTLFVTDMSGMFSGCSSLASLNVSGFDTSAVTDMSNMFSGCAGLASLDVSGFDTSAVTDMSNMFSGCAGLQTLNVKNWSAASVENMSGMFSGCSGLTSLTIKSEWSFPKVTDMSNMFSGCSKLKTLSLTSWYASSLKNTSGMFSGCSGLTSLDVKNWYTSKVEDMSSMFEGCPGLTSLGVRKDTGVWETNNVVNMSSIFKGCSGLTTLNLNWTVSKVTDMSSMFEGCEKLTSPGVSGWNTTNVQNMSSMFKGCEKLTSMDIKYWELSKVTNMSSMFEGCSGLTSFTMTWYGSKIQNMSSMFKGCSGLTSLKFDLYLADLTDMSNLFDGCSKLQTVDLSIATLDNVTDAADAFAGCSALTTVKAPKNLTVDCALPTVTDGAWVSGSKTYTALPKEATSSLTLKVGYKVNIDSSMANGSVSSDKEYASTDDTVVLTVAPASEYMLTEDSLKVTYNTSETCTLTPNETDTTKFTFTMPAYPVTVTAAFKEAPAHTHDSIEKFTAWKSNNSLPTEAGNYYLTKDVTLSGTWTVPNGSAGAPKTTNLCLNGHVIKLGEEITGSVIKVPKYTTLNLYDCGQTKHYFSVDSTTGLWTLLDEEADGCKTVTGGVITGGAASNIYYGGGVYISGNGASFVMEKGTISGNTTTDGHGGGVYVTGTNATFTMKAGTISENATTDSSSKYGGGVYVDSGASFEMKDGTINKNESAGKGGGVYVGTSIFTMKAGTISENKATDGAGIYVNDDNNTGSLVTIKGGTISKNEASSSTGGVYLAGRKSIFKMENSEITDNSGSGVYVGEGSTLILGGTARITGNTVTQGKVQNCVRYKGIIEMGTGTGNGVAAPADGMLIGISRYNYGTDPDQITVADEAYSNYVKYFTSDSTLYYVDYDSTNKYIGFKALSGSGKGAVTVAASEHGVVYVNKQAAEARDEITVEVVPEDESYELESLKWTPEGGSATDITSDLKFNMPNPVKNVTVTATFKVAGPSVSVKTKSGVSNPVYNTASNNLELYTVKPINFVPQTLAVQWKYVDDQGAVTWKAEAPATGLSVGTDGKVSTATDTPAGDYVFRITNDKPETIKDEDSGSTTYNQMIPNPEFVSSKPVTLTVEKATPSVSEWPTVTAFDYGTYETIGAIQLSGGTAGVDGNFAWDTEIASTSATVAKSGSYAVVFTPNNSNYSTVSHDVTVTINKATPTVSTTLTATVTYGDTVSAGVISGAMNVDGTFAWKDSVTTYGNATNGTARELDAVFTPTDTDNYKQVDVKVSVTVNKATYTDVTTTASGNLKAKKDATVDITLPDIPEGASYGTPVNTTNAELFSVGTITNKNLTVTSLRDWVKVSDGEDAKTFTVPVTEPNHVTYDITVSVTPEYHTHSFTYTASGSKITATCTEGCTEGWDKKPVTLTLTAEDAFYDGAAYDGASTDDATTKFAETTEQTVTIEYWPTGEGAEKQDTAPTNAGSYVAKVTVGDKTAEKTFTIKKRPVTLIAGSAEKAYDETPLTCTTFTVKTDTTTAGYGFVGEEGIASVTMTEASTITDVGSVDNVIDAKTGKSGTNLNNYDITTEKGTLTVKALAETAPATGTGYTLDYIAETLKAADSKYEVSSTNGDTATPLPNDKVTPDATAQTFYVRKVASDKNHAPSAWTEITVPAYPAAPTTGSVASTTENSITVTGMANAEYSTDGTDWQDSNVFNTGLTAATKYTVYIRLKATATAFASAAQEIDNVYTAAATPENVAETGTVSYTDETFTPKTGYEISTKNGTDFAAMALTGGKVTLEPSTTYYIRHAASTTPAIPASAAISLTIPERPTTPGKPELDDVTDTTVVVKAVNGQEYSIDNGTNWAIGASGKVTFNSLTENTGYSIITRVKATASSFKSESSAALSVTTKTAAADAPSIAPVVTAMTVTLPYDENYEYKTGDGEWQSGEGTNVFTGLTPKTEFTYYVRVKGTDTAMPSQTATVTCYTAYATPANVAETGTVSYADETFAPKDGYEISEADAPNFVAMDLTSGKVTLEPSTTYYIRHAAAKTPNAIPASATISLTIPARPTKPGTPELDDVTDTTVTVKALSGQEYSKDAGASWVSDDDGNGKISFNGYSAEGDYSIITRVEVTASSFKSDSSTALSGKTAQSAPTENTGYSIDYAAEKITVKPGYEISKRNDPFVPETLVESKMSITPDTAYYIRKAAKENGAPASAATRFTTVQRPAAPETPELDSVTRTTVTVKALSGQEYSKDAGASWVSDDDSDGKISFTGYNAGGDYSIITRVKAVTTTGSEAFASASSTALTGTTTRPDDSVIRSAITVNNAKNGSVSADKETAYEGSTITITVTPDKGFALETLTVLDKNGKQIEVKNLGNKKYSFKMPAGKVSISATFMEDNSMLNFFVDVKATDYYYDAVLWAAENGITKGTDDVHFSPDMGTTRAQVVTFLWRAAGCPEPTGDASKFTDVVIGSYYEKAVAWAIEQGITKGTSDTTFSPDMVCTRGQIVTFLARFAGVEDADTASAFTDVKTTDYFAAAVKWAKDNKVTEGTSATTFSPNDKCTRAQVVTFLYRWIVK